MSLWMAMEDEYSLFDDDADCRALVEAQLEEAGYVVHTACDGVAGLDEMRGRRHYRLLHFRIHRPRVRRLLQNRVA